MKNSKHCFIITRSHLLKLKNVLDKSCRQKPNTRFMFNNNNNIFFPKILLQSRNFGSLLHSNYPVHLVVIDLFTQLTISLRTVV